MNVRAVKAAATVLLLICARSAMEVAEGIRSRNAKCSLDRQVVVTFDRKPY